METTEQNKLIAEFMGMTYSDPNDNSVMTQMTHQGNEVVPIESMEYHTSWDEFMPVAKRVYDIISPIIDGKNGEYENYIGDMSMAILDIDIQEANKCAIKAIVWYNKNQTEQL